MFEVGHVKIKIFFKKIDTVSEFQMLKCSLLNSIKFSSKILWCRKGLVVRCMLDLTLVNIMRVSCLTNSIRRQNKITLKNMKVWLN